MVNAGCEFVSDKMMATAVRALIAAVADDSGSVRRGQVVTRRIGVIAGGDKLWEEGAWDEADKRTCIRGLEKGMRCVEVCGSEVDLLGVPEFKVDLSAPGVWDGLSLI